MPASPASFFQQQTILLTGGTGGLGGCLLFKLAVKLDAFKIYVLIRGSTARAKARWAQTMPHHIDAILATNKIHFIEGDITDKNFGIAPSVLAEMAAAVTIVIHAAANISLKDALPKTVRNNCLSSLELAQLASTFKNLSAFVHISSAYCNSFLPDGVVEERIYPLGDAERQLADILDTGSLSTNHASTFPWPYAFGKHLTERLLLSRYPKLPLLIVRPTTIGPAIAEPYRYYGPAGSCPHSTYIRSYMNAPDSGVFHVLPENRSGLNILDEIPVDLVANLVLLHTLHGTTGIIRAHMPLTRFPHRTSFQYVSDKGIPEGRYAQFWKTFSRNWRFSNTASRGLEEFKGVLELAVPAGHDVGEFMAGRARRIAEELSVAHKAKL
ncbi:male sterility protein-domain-containing protein [Mycena crocata]|nr:male sterility protein-domain-containing protein [Mycena crocata]